MTVQYNTDTSNEEEKTEYNNKIVIQIEKKRQFFQLHTWIFASTYTHTHTAVYLTSVEITENIFIHTL